MAKKPDIDIRETERLIEKILDTNYRCLVSGDRKHFDAAMARLDAFRSFALLVDGLVLVGRVKKWINQDDATKDVAYLDETYQIADPRGDGLPDADKDDKWLWKGRSARALFYAGRFKRARKRFKRVYDRVKKDFSKVKLATNLPHAYDIRAAQAEFEVYMGYPRDALERLDEIPANDRQAWHEWVRAFAFHQLGFADRVPFGSNPSSTLPRVAKRYVDSNAILENLRKRPDRDLSPPEKHDTYLLTAANYGALFRLGDSNAEQLARQALADFGQSPDPDGKNRRWSWEKEQRGRFPERAFPGERPSGSAVKRWRTAYKFHYRDNLVDGAHLPLEWSDRNDDGDIDLVDDHPDDDDRPE